MELKPGYKQTEVGVIPEDWDVKRLRDISPSQSVGLVINPSSYFEANGEVPMLVGSCISENKINAEKASRISSKNSERLSACRLKAGDLVTVRVGFPGTTAVVPTELDGCNCASMMIIRRHKSFDSYWLAQLLNSPIGRVQIENVEYGTAQKQFNISHAIDFIFPVPPPAEQSKIAEAVKNFDEYIESLEQKIEKKRRIKQAAMQELLTGKRRLPGFEGEWVVKRLGDITSIDPESLGNHTHPNYSFNYISLEDVDQGSLLGWSEQEYVSAPSRARRKLRPNDVLISTVRPNLKSHLLFDQEGGEWICSTGFALLRCNKDTIEPAFVYFHLFGDTISKQIEALMTGSNYPAINSRDVRNLEIPVPALLEQKEIVRILKSMEDELISLAQQFEKASSLKQGMMQQLLTGKIRLT